jgi:hypothetical protein
LVVVGIKDEGVEEFFRANKLWNDLAAFNRDHHEDHKNRVDVVRTQ